MLGGEYEVLAELKGGELEYMEYEQLMPFTKADKKAFFVTLADYVTTDRRYRYCAYRSCFW